MSVCVLAIFKNEAVAMDEWLQHYISQGVSHFYLINNGSTDDFMPIIQHYSQYITLYHFPEKHSQVIHYNKVLPTIKNSGYTWCCIADFDEFIVLSDPTLSIPGYCRRRFINDVAEVRIPWKIFGSNGYIQHPKSIRTSFTKCWPELVSYKSIVRIDRCKYLDVHTHKVDGSITMANDALFYHYVIQSWEWFESVKMTRGASDVRENETLRDRAYFDKYDIAATSTDTVLKDRVEAGMYNISEKTFTGLYGITNSITRILRTNRR
jgi:hypothetical protein